MSIFAYNPEAVKSWANGVVNYLNGSSDSMNDCSKKFAAQLEKLSRPNVWTGAAAAQNYQNFVETHELFVKFINSFGMAFEESMKAVNTSVANLEVANLGQSTNVSGALNSLEYSQISSIVPESIRTEIVTYDYNTIIEIGQELKSILVKVEGTKDSLIREVGKIGEDTELWSGDAANSAKSELLSVINNNIPSLIEGLNVCISNISNAANSALSADKN